jgi:p-hydroxybenzoate 3-monooxygenase
MNLAVADVLILEHALRALLLDGDDTPLSAYPERALHRIWKAQHFSWWMTNMLHAAPDASDFDRRRQLGELRSVVESTAGSTYLAEAYTGWPLPRL